MIIYKLDQKHFGFRWQALQLEHMVRTQSAKIEQIQINIHYIICEALVDYVDDKIYMWD